MAAMLAPAGVAGISAVRPVQRAFSSHHQRRPRTVMAVRAEDAKVTREFKEGDAKATPAKGDGALYADQIKEMQKKLRDEYLGFGGSPNTPMGANYFLYIILGVSFLAVLSWLSGAI